MVRQIIDNLETGPLLVSLGICVFYIFHALITRQEVPDLCSILGIALSCVGLYTGMLLIFSVFNNALKEIILAEYLMQAFFISGMAIFLTSLQGILQTMKSLQNDKEAQIDRRHVYGAMVIILVLVVCAGGVSHYSSTTANDSEYNNLAPASGITSTP